MEIKICQVQRECLRQLAGEACFVHGCCSNAGDRAWHRVGAHEEGLADEIRKRLDVLMGRELGRWKGSRRFDEKG